MTDVRRPSKMSQQRLEDIRKEELTDISQIHLDENLSPEQKMYSFLEQVGNPYCFLCGETPVQICFTENGPELGELLQAYFLRLKQG